VCPVKIDLRQFWLGSRQQVASRNLTPRGLVHTHEHVTDTGNVFAYPNDERLDWADYMLDAPDDLFRREEAEVLYFVGCVSSFSPAAQVIPEAFVRVLSAAGVDFTVLGDDERCCGFPLEAAGMPDAFDALRRHNLEQARARGVHTVVFTCPACRLAWMEAYAPYWPDVRLLHATEFIAQLLADGRLKPGQLERVVTYHDPCDLGRNGGVYDAPRHILAAIPGVQLREVRQRRERGLCCGGGGDLEMVDPELVTRVAAGTVRALASTGADAIVTACQQCLRTLQQAVASEQLEVEVLDIVQLVAQALQPDARRGG
jgi:heterodisulfide reductase subunit D